MNSIGILMEKRELFTSFAEMSDLTHPPRAKRAYDNPIYSFHPIENHYVHLGLTCFVENKMC